MKILGFGLILSILLMAVACSNDAPLTSPAPNVATSPSIASAATSSETSSKPESPESVQGTSITESSPAEAMTSPETGTSNIRCGRG